MSIMGNHLREVQAQRDEIGDGGEEPTALDEYEMLAADLLRARDRIRLLESAVKQALETFADIETYEPADCPRELKYADIAGHARGAAGCALIVIKHRIGDHS